MYQEEFFIEDIWAAIRLSAQAIAASEGKAKSYLKVVGHMLWQHKDPDDAGKYFSNCLDPSRNEKLDPQQILFIAKKARSVGCHALVWFICEDTGYQKAVPVEVEDEAAELTREIIETSKRMERNLERLEQLKTQMLKAVKS